MAVGGARGIAVGAAVGGSNPGTSQDQRPRESAIGAAPAGNPRSRWVWGGGGGGGAERRRRWWWTEEEGSRGFVLYIASRKASGGGGESRTGQGPEKFSASAFRLVPLVRLG
jgi:hypothetical protein